MKVVSRNRRALAFFEIFEKYQAGIELKGCEVKSLREGLCDISESYGIIKQGEVFLYNFHISPYPFAQKAPPPQRPKKLLLHKLEILELLNMMKQKKLVLIPLRVYFNSRGLAKVEIALARRKKLKARKEELKRKALLLEISTELKYKERGGDT